MSSFDDRTEVTATKDLSPVEGALNRLAQVVNEAHARVEMLEVRLAPVLRSAPGTAISHDPREAEVRSPVVETVRLEIGRIEGLCSRLAEISDRLDT